MSRTLEYAYDDFALAQMAKALGKTDDYQALIQRAANYRNVIDSRTGYAQGRHADGTFLNDANASISPVSLLRALLAIIPGIKPQDPYGLMDCMGGKDKYVAKLDSMFSEQRYWHGNSPVIRLLICSIMQASLGKLNVPSGILWKRNI